MSDLIQASLAEIRARLAGGDVSAEAVAKACLDRIAETEPSIHALITVREQALEEARALDAQGPDASKPLWGVPVTVKDAIITKGIIALLIRVLSGRTPQEIVDSDLYFIDRIGLRENLSPTRANGLLAMIKQMKLYALAYQNKQ